MKDHSIKNIKFLGQFFMTKICGFKGNFLRTSLPRIVGLYKKLNLVNNSWDCYSRSSWPRIVELFLHNFKQILIFLIKSKNPWKKNSNNLLAKNMFRHFWIFLWFRFKYLRTKNTVIFPIIFFFFQGLRVYFYDFLKNCGTRNNFFWEKFTRT